MDIKYLLAAYAPKEALIQEQDSPARGRERYSADDIVRLFEAFNDVRLDRHSRRYAMVAIAGLLMDNIEKLMQDYDLSYADTALFLNRNGISTTERILRCCFADAEEAKDVVSAAK